MTERSADETFDAGRWLRAIRRARSLSQRELAVLAAVPVSTVSAIESGHRRVGLAVFVRIVSAAGHRVEVVDADTGAAAALDDVHDRLRDRAGRRLPAHLRWGDRPSISGAYWWGWHRVAWYDNTAPRIPDHAYWQRSRPRRGPLREHPWHGQFRARNGCFGPESEPCADCVDNCLFGQSRPREGPPDVPPA